MEKNNAAEKAILRAIVVQPSRVDATDIEAWKSAVNNAKRGNRSALYNLYENLLSDPVLSEAVESRIEAITNAEITFQVDGKNIEEIDDMIDTPEFEELIREIALQRAWGKSVIDTSFDPEFTVFPFPRKNVRIRGMEKPRSEWKKYIAVKESDQDGYDYTQDEFIIECGKDDDLGYLWKAAQYVIYKRGNFGDWAQFAEIFGMPFLVGRYNSHDTTTRDQLYEALGEIGGKPFAAIPTEANIEFHENKSSGSNDLYNALRRACNEEILIAVKGNTMTTLDGSSRAQAEVHADAQSGKTKSDRRYVQRVLNKHFVPLLIKRGYPVTGGFFLFPEQGEKMKVSEQVDLGLKLRNAGIPVADNYFYEITGIPASEKDEPTEEKKNKGKEEEQPTEPEPGTAGKKDDKPAKKTKLFDRFFAFAPTPRSGAKLKPSWIGSIARIAINLADKAELGIDIDRLFARALEEIYRSRGDGAVNKSLFDISNTALQKAVDKSFKKAGIEFGKKNEAFIAEFKQNTAIFAAFKAHHQGRDIAAMLFNEEGNLRPFHEFKKAVLGTSIDRDYNRNWLRTEYNMAVRSARTAADFKRYQATAHLYPNLEYLESTAKEKRDEHLAYVGTVLPIDHPWWNTHMPPSDWGCECSVRNTDKPVTPVPSGGSDPLPVFANNPGKTAEFLNINEHPYVKGVAADLAESIRRAAREYIEEVKDFFVRKDYKNGGKVLVHKSIEKGASDYKAVLTIATEFAKTGREAALTPKLHPKSEEYKEIYGQLKGTRYWGKSPDLRIDGVFYEYEGYVPPFKKRKIANMISHGAAQSQYIIINNNKGASHRYIRRSILSRLNDKNFKGEIKEVWVYEKGKVTLLYKKQQGS